jgi:hypothetical protein
MRPVIKLPRVLFVAIACAAVIVVGAGPATAAPDPITPANRPTPLAGAVNGEVPPQRLVNVAANCRTAREAGPSLYRLFAMARQRGVSLGAEECYRPLADQVKYANQAQQPGNNPACVASVGRSSNGTPVGRSYHGWGKAVDLTDAGHTVRFSSPGFAFMEQFAGSVGWNLAAFARPGTSCPEPWHWEWVGDGGIIGGYAKRGDVVGLLPSGNDQGYAVVTVLGAVSSHGNFSNRGGASNITLAWVIVGAANTPKRDGYWLVGRDGGVFTYGGARYFGSTGAKVLAEPVHTLTPTKSGNGYWLIAWDGGVFTFGDARFFGSTGAKRLVSPVVGMARTKSGNGYWLVAGDGGIFTFGDARFFGSIGGHVLAQPVMAMTTTPTGNGYWLVASDGGVFSFGDAKFYGSLGATRLPAPAVSMVATKSGHGYWIVLANGDVHAFGDAGRFGNG